MKINFEPILCWPDTDVSELNLIRDGDVLIVRGQEYDFSVIPNGATLPEGQTATQSECFTGPIERDLNGQISLTIRMPVLFSAPESARFPQPIIDPPDGPIDLPQTNWPPAPEQTEQGGEDASN